MSCNVAWDGDDGGGGGDDDDDDDNDSSNLKDIKLALHVISTNSAQFSISCAV
jgi:hypothetical protein